MNKVLKIKIIQKFDSQANFAQAMRIPEPVISRVIRERQVLKPGEQRRWAASLECKLEEIFDATEKSKEQ